jgi:arsenate reductase (thioredoxin)
MRPVMPAELMIRGRPRRSTAVALLRAQGLPASDITDEHLEHFFFSGSDESPTGLVGVEIYGTDALLRSLVVAESTRSRGVGAALVQYVEDYAASRRVGALYLLTTTAESFFERRGYRRVDRAQAPRSIQSTLEFSSLCPASSAFMIKQLNPLLRQVTGRLYNVLFLCTGNSARSILAESLLNHWGKGRFRAFSAGSHPKGKVHPMALELLKRTNLPTDDLRSKSWDEFTAPGAPPLDFIFTVCDNAAGEVCPVWPGRPMTAHWGIADPAAAQGTDAEKALAFRQALEELDARIELFTNLPIESLDSMTLHARLRDIGKSSAATEPA